MGRLTRQTGAFANNGHTDDAPDETTRLLAPNVEQEEYHKPIWDGLTEFQHLPKWRRPSIVWLMSSYTLYTLAYGGVMVPKITLVVDLVCNKHFADKAATAGPSYASTPTTLASDNAQCNSPQVQKKVAEFVLVINLLIGILSALSAPKLGKLSDRYGRCRLMAVSSLGGIMSEVITVLAANFPKTIDYRWLILASIFEGLTGSFTSGSILSQAYTSDCTPPSKRAVYMGYLYGCLLGGIALGPLLAGFLIKFTGSIITLFYVVLVCHVVFAMFICFVVPESLSKRRRHLAREKHRLKEEALAQSPKPRLASLVHKNPFAPLAALWPRGPGTSRQLRVNLVALAVTDAIILCAMLSVSPVVILYGQYMFDWGSFELSLFVSATTSGRVLVLVVLGPLIHYWFRVRPGRRRQRQTGGRRSLVEKTGGADKVDIWTLRAALLLDMVGAACYTFARSETAFVFSSMITAFGGLGSVTTQSAITKHVPPSSVGEILGAVGMLGSISRVIGPILFNGLYAMTVKVFPQAIFTVLLGMYGFVFLVSFVVRPHVVWEHESEAPSPPATDNVEDGALMHEAEAII